MITHTQKRPPEPPADVYFFTGFLAEHGESLLHKLKRNESSD